VNRIVEIIFGKSECTTNKTTFIVNGRRALLIDMYVNQSRMICECIECCCRPAE